MDIVLSSERVDVQECDVLVSGFFQDERPLQGSIGWIDWRLNGTLSRIVAEKRLTGEWRETTLIPSQGRLAPRLIFLIGLGKSKEYSYIRVRDLPVYLLESLEKLRTPNVCISLPYDEKYNVDCGKLTEILVEGIVDCLDSQAHSFDEDWANNLRLFFAEGEERFPEILLGLKTAKSMLQGRRRIRIYVPTEKAPKALPE
jgi:hypothetical protein